jgi:hypothetical protein
MYNSITRMQNIQAVSMKTISICQKVLLKRRLIMGKGSSARPIPNPKKFEENWDRIFGKKDGDKSKHTDKKKTD